MVKEEVEKDGICNIIMYTLFPSSNIGMSHELKKLDSDIEKLNSQLSEERALFASNARIYKKLKDPKIQMADPSMTRSDAIKDVLGKLKSSRARIKLLEVKVNLYQESRHRLEANQLTADMDTTVEALNYRMRKVRAIDPEKMVRNMDEIAENTKELKDVHDRVNDAFVSGWSADVDVSEVELEEYLNSMDQDELNLEQRDESKVEDEIDLMKEEKNLYRYDSDEVGEAEDVYYEEKPINAKPKKAVVLF
jgi:hypothetical protein